MITETTKRAPRMHYYIVRWRGETQIRSCSEYLMSDERPIALVHKDKYYRLHNLVREKGLTFYRMTSRQVKTLLNEIN